MSKTRGTRAAVVAGACATLTLIAAGPAMAKSDISLSAHSAKVRVGQTTRLSTTAGDDGAQYQRLCVERQNGRTWQVLRCVNGGQDGVSLSLSVKITHSGRTTFRAQLFSTDAHHGHLKLDRTSAVVAVTGR
ncbi:hypothetical protein ABH920_005188 [Catenulispora sp. EB89]|uniref:hypothetical protein n=1 Tax=Catenulispora sp. EB89 TaxID=3156257 RepID=UPI003517F2B7